MSDLFDFSLYSGFQNVLNVILDPFLLYKLFSGYNSISNSQKGIIDGFGIEYDWNNVAPKNFLNDLGVAMGLSNFNEASQELKIIAQFMGVLLFILYFLKPSSSLSISTIGFIGMYVAQKVAKIAVFILKDAGIDNSVEKNLYVFSAMINTIQMVLSILGIG